MAGRASRWHERNDAAITHYAQELIMRLLMHLSGAASGAMQVPLSVESVPTLLTVATALAGLVVLVYHFGGWRQDMVNLKTNIAADVARYYKESAEEFRRFDERFAAIERFIEQSTEQRVAHERWEARVDATLTAIDGTLARIGGNG